MRKGKKRKKGKEINEERKGYTGRKERIQMKTEKDIQEERKGYKRIEERK